MAAPIASKNFSSLTALAATPAVDDELFLFDTSEGTATDKPKRCTTAELAALSPAETTTTTGALINGATAKTTPVDADMVGLMDSAAGNILKQLSWANIKATLLATANIWTAQQNFQAVAITSSGASIAWNLATAQVAKHTATENTTLAAPSNIIAGGTYILIWTQHASSPKTLSWNAAYKFPGGSKPSVTATNGAIDVFTFVGGPAGATLLGVSQKAFA